MPSQKEEKIVPFSQQQMFNLVADVDKYEDFLPWCNSSKIISKESRDADDIMIADLEIGYDQFVYTYRSEIILSKDHDLIKVRNLEGPFKYLSNEWKFEVIDENTCKINFEIDFELNIKFFDLLMKKFFDLAFKKMVDAFLERANEIY